MGRRTLPLLSVFVVAVGTVAAGAHFASGADSADETVFVPVTPCRLVDTRPNITTAPDRNVGPRNTPIGESETVEFAAREGADGNSPCDIPSSATAINTNTVAVGPTARSYLTLFPGDVSNPGTSNLNFVAGQAPTPNAATVPLSATGTFKVFNFVGAVHVVIDVNGYFQPSTNVGVAGPAGPAGAAGLAGAAGPAGLTGPSGASGPEPGASCENPGGTAKVNAGYNNKGAYYTACGDLTLTYAGSSSGSFGPVSGTASDRAEARFSFPQDVHVMASGGLVIAETGSNRIRGISAGGNVTTVAGDVDGTGGFVDGAAAIARFNQPFSLTSDAAGNLYVADSGNHRIRKITPAGVVSTFAGDGTPGFLDGPGATAQFSSPHGIAHDGAGNLYVADSGNNRIRKITPAGVVSTLAGDGTLGFLDGPGATAQFSNPEDLDVDTAGNVYVADLGNFRIRKITAAGVVSTLAGTGSSPSLDGPVGTAQFDTMFGITVVGPGTLLVTEGMFGTSAKVRRVTSSGVTTVAGGPSVLPGPGGGGLLDGGDATFAWPRGLDVDGNGRVFLADQYGGTIREILGLGN